MSVPDKKLIEQQDPKKKQPQPAAQPAINKPATTGPQINTPKQR